MVAIFSWVKPSIRGRWVLSEHAMREFTVMAGGFVHFLMALDGCISRGTITIGSVSQTHRMKSAHALLASSLSAILLKLLS